MSGSFSISSSDLHVISLCLSLARLIDPVDALHPWIEGRLAKLAAMTPAVGEAVQRELQAVAGQADRADHLFVRPQRVVLIVGDGDVLPPVFVLGFEARHVAGRAGHAASLRRASPRSSASQAAVMRRADIGLGVLVGVAGPSRLRPAPGHVSKRCAPWQVVQVSSTPCAFALIGRRASSGRIGGSVASASRPPNPGMGGQHAVARAACRACPR